ncbi:hypothetical protein HY622_03395 [Candidatus Uhrbacteria bacterium]|nr:hypothetical protein [Candidatus Uhrbacteria bacterium]
MALSAQNLPLPGPRPRRTHPTRTPAAQPTGVIIQFPRQPSAPPPPPPPSPSEEEEEDGDDEGRAERMENFRRLATAKRASFMQAYNLAMQFRAAESEHRNEVFFMVLIAAMVIDGIDLVEVVVQAGGFASSGAATATVIGAPIGAAIAAISAAATVINVILNMVSKGSLQLFLFFFMFGRGTWFLKLIVIPGVLMLELIPGIDALPVETLCVAYAWFESARKAQEDGETAEDYEKQSQVLQRSFAQTQRELAGEEES